MPVRFFRKTRDYIVDIVENPMLGREFALRNKSITAISYSLIFLFLFLFFNLFFPQPIIIFSLACVSALWFFIGVIHFLAFMQNARDNERGVKYTLKKRKYIVVDFWLGIFDDVISLVSIFLYNLSVMSFFFFSPFIKKTLLTTLNQEYIHFFLLFYTLCFVFTAGSADSINYARKDFVGKLRLYYKRKQNLKDRKWRRVLRQFKEKQEQKICSEEMR